MRYFHEAVASRRRGATALEYLFVLSLIVCAALTAIGSLGQSAKDSLQKSSNAVQQATSSTGSSGASANGGLSKSSGKSR